MSASEDPRVRAVRADPVVGRGSGSAIDECLDAEDLVDYFNEDDIKTSVQAVRWARKHERLQLEVALNQREGTDHDPALKWMADFEAACKAHPWWMGSSNPLGKRRVVRPKCFCGCGRAIPAGRKGWQHFATAKCARVWAEYVAGLSEKEWCPVCDAWTDYLRVDNEGVGDQKAVCGGCRTPYPEKA